MALEYKIAVGTFPNLQNIESALSQLQETGFLMNQVSVVAPQSDSPEPKLGELTAPLAESEDKLARDLTTEQIWLGATGAGAIGSVVGGVVAGLTTLSFPAFSGAVVLVGMASGAFYGAISGGVLGGGIGGKTLDKQSQHYHDLLAQGHYLVSISATKDEIDRAESVLKTANIQDWMIFDPL